MQVPQTQDREELAGKQFCRKEPKQHHQPGDNAITRECITLEQENSLQNPWTC